MNTSLTLAALITLATLAACAPSSQTYGPDGRVAHAISCGGVLRGWDDCYQKAGALCQRAGYDVVSRNSAPRVVATEYFSGATSDRSMVIACKA